VTDLIIVDRRLPQVLKEVGDGFPDGPPRGAAGGFFSATSDAEHLAKLRRIFPGAVDEDRPMSVRVKGGPMDIHGEGIPLPTRYALRDRMAKAGEPNTGEGVLIGSVDTGIQRIPWLDGGYLSAPNDFETHVPQKADEAGKLGATGQMGHGTFVAGLVLQQAPAAGVWVERALSLSGEASSIEVAAAAGELARRGVDILNLSLGCYANEPNARQVMQRLVDELRSINSDMVIVAAAGNLDPDDQALETRQAFWPAALDNVVAVGAVDGPDATTWSSWSNRGPWIDFAAPANDLLSTFVDGYLKPAPDRPPNKYEGWAQWSGTSFAAAVVSGAIAREMTGTERLSAAEAVARLRAGTYSSGWTDAEPAVEDDGVDGVPSVPIVTLATWADQGEAKKSWRIGPPPAAAAS
jgi:hypothetical protein